MARIFLVSAGLCIATSIIGGCRKGPAQSGPASAPPTSAASTQPASLPNAEPLTRPGADGLVVEDLDEAKRRAGELAQIRQELRARAMEAHGLRPLAKWVK